MNERDKLELIREKRELVRAQREIMTEKLNSEKRFEKLMLDQQEKSKKIKILETQLAKLLRPATPQPKLSR